MFIKILTIIAAAIGVLYGGWILLASASDQLIVGHAQVIDGDTLDIGPQRVRLFGVDALEIGQVCDYRGTKWLCGSKAALDLAEWLGQATIVCRRRGKPYDRTVASCIKGAIDVGGWSVSRGLSVADTCYSRSYVAEQERARAAGTGVWSSTFELPKVWRYEHRSDRGGLRPRADGQRGETLLIAVGCNSRRKLFRKGRGTYRSAKPHPLSSLKPPCVRVVFGSLVTRYARQPTRPFATDDAADAALEWVSKRRLMRGYSVLPQRS